RSRWRSRDSRLRSPSRSRRSCRDGSPPAGSLRSPCRAQATPPPARARRAHGASSRSSSSSTTGSPRPATPLPSGRTSVPGPGPAGAIPGAVAAGGGARGLPAGGSWPATLVLEPSPLARFGVRTAALASGDLDGDGRPELVALVGGELVVLAPTGASRLRQAL